MAERKTAKTGTGATRASASAKGFTAEERAAMRERARELKAQASREDGEKALLAKIGEMEGTDRALATRLHEIVTETAPHLEPRTWYGMPAYAKDGKILCFFQSAAKFGVRYATFGFNDVARLDQGTMWPTSWALTELTPAVEKKITALVRKAVR